ncbi:hypothetical protein WR25_26930 [Diploscapter pachys]|uniref:Uncharacterized protein n=1 Tax=Diploscapter pachys TaxID=2018661 RepID=A0A2A2JV26_9BILA|nr:hypothetical protein WR25_26930 [Diploscapter pachys]
MPGDRKVGRERERNEERGRTGVDRKEARSEKRPAQKDKAAAEIGEGLQTCRRAKSNNEANSLFRAFRRIGNQFETNFQTLLILAVMFFVWYKTMGGHFWNMAILVNELSMNWMNWQRSIDRLIDGDKGTANL